MVARVKPPRYELGLARRAWGSANHALRLAEDNIYHARRRLEDAEEAVRKWDRERAK